MYRILILGSTYLTQLCVHELLRSGFSIVGYVPSKFPFKKGTIPLPLYTDQEYDIALSIQYDRKVKLTKPGYNLHTGLLPEFGGLNILRHTLDEGCREQGLTFHRMTDQFDYGPIISKITYPVFDDDTISKLYRRQLLIAPNFLVSCLNLINVMKNSHIYKCNQEQPRLLKRNKL